MAELIRIAPRNKVTGLGKFSGDVRVLSPISVGDGSFVHQDVVSGEEPFAHAEGFETSALTPFSIALGSRAIGRDRHSFVWSGDRNVEYGSHGEGSFSINPKNGPDDFYIDGVRFPSYFSTFVVSSADKQLITGDIEIVGKFINSDGLDFSLSRRRFGDCSVANGLETSAFGFASHAEGVNSVANGEGSHAEGCNTVSDGDFSHAEGIRARTVHGSSFSWNGDDEINGFYDSKGDRTYCVNPRGGANGFFIGDDSVYTIFDSLCSYYDGVIKTASDSYPFLRTFGRNEVQGVKTFGSASTVIASSDSVRVPTVPYIADYSNKAASTKFVYSLMKYLNSIINISAGTYANDNPILNGQYANDPMSFYYNTVATSVNDGSSPQNGTFYNCVDMVTFNAENVTSIGSYAFYNCHSLTDVSVGELSHIGTGAFANCSSLATLDTSHVTSFGSGIFEGCSSLVELSFDSLTKSQLESMANYPTLFGEGSYKYVSDVYIEIRTSDRTFPYQRPTHVHLDLCLPAGEPTSIIQTSGTTDIYYYGKNDHRDAYKKYYVDGGCTVLSPSGQESDGLTIEEPFITRKYKFMGYYCIPCNLQFIAPSGSDGRTVISDSLRTSDLYGDSVTLTARWQLNEFTVSFDPTQGTHGSVTSEQVIYGESMPPLTSAGQLPTRVGYSFGGYSDRFGKFYYDGGGHSTSNWDKTDDYTLSANWTPNTYKVAFNGNGPSDKIVVPLTGIDVTYDEMVDDIGISNIPTRVGYSFDGYYDDEV